jgi:hypothetical protein
VIIAQHDDEARRHGAVITVPLLPPVKVDNVLAMQELHPVTAGDISVE